MFNFSALLLGVLSLLTVAVVSNPLAERQVNKSIPIHHAET